MSTPSNLYYSLNLLSWLHLFFVTVLLLFPTPSHESGLPLFATRTISESGVMSHVPISRTGCPKKKWDLCLNAHNNPCKWTTDKSRVSFGKFRKFPFHWAQEHLLFGKKWMRKLRSKLPTPHLKTYISEWHTVDFAFVSVVCNLCIFLAAADFY